MVSVSFAKYTKRTPAPRQPPNLSRCACDAAELISAKFSSGRGRFRGPTFDVRVEPGLHSRSKPPGNPALNRKTKTQERCNDAIHDDSQARLERGPSAQAAHGCHSEARRRGGQSRHAARA